MVGLLGYALAGMAEGAGNSIVDQAKAKREAALEELRANRDMAFRRGEREASQVFTSGENDKTRAFSAEQGQLGRDASAPMVTTEDGNSARVLGTRVEPILGPDGKPARLATTKDNPPADVATAEWMIQNGVAKDYNEAWEKIRTGRTPPVTAADIEKMVEDATDTEFKGALGRPKPEDIEAARERNRARILKNLGIGENPAAEGASSRPAGMDDAAVIQQAKEAIKKGAPADSVAARLRQMGIDPKAAGL